MSNEAIARVYASALFAAADEAHGVDRVRAELGQLVTALTESQALRSVLENPQIELRAKQRVLAGLTEGGDRLLVNMLHLLAEKGRLTLLAGVRDDFERLAAEQARTIKLEVTSAVSLDADLEEQIVARVEQATGKKALLSKTIDETILGGLVLRLGDTIIDGSLRARLAQLRKRLITAEVRGGE